MKRKIALVKSIDVILDEVLGSGALLDSPETIERIKRNKDNLFLDDDPVADQAFQIYGLTALGLVPVVYFDDKDGERSVPLYPDQFKIVQ